MTVIVQCLHETIEVGSDMQKSLTKKVADLSANNSFYFIFHCDVCEKPWRSVSPATAFSNIDFSKWEKGRQAAYERASIEAEEHFSPCPEGDCMICSDCLCSVSAGVLCADCQAAQKQPVSVGVEAFGAAGIDTRTEAKILREAKETRKLGMLGRLHAVRIMAACALVAIVGLGAVFLSSMFVPTMEFCDLEVPLASLYSEEVFLPIDADAKPLVREGVGVHGAPGQQIQDMEGSHIPVSGDKADVLLLNPVDNACYLLFALALPDTGETLYRSGLIEPGLCVETPSLRRSLVRGAHQAEWTVYTYSFDGFSVLGDYKMETTLDVY